MYYSAIGLLAAAVLLIENYTILLRKDPIFDEPVWNKYRRFLLAVLAYYVTDILWGVLESGKFRLLLFADTTVYYIAMGASLLFWSLFTVAYLGETDSFGRFLVYAGYAFAGMISLLAVVNIFIPVLFTVDSDCVYRALPVRYLQLVCQIVLLMLTSVFAYTRLRFRPGNKDKRYAAFLLFGLVSAFFLLIQLWFPYLPLYGTAYLLGTSLLHTFVVIERREETRRGLEEAGEIRQLKDTIVSLLDNMPGMTFTKDAETGVYLACNQAFANYAHKETPAGVVGLTDAQIFDAKTAAHFVEDDKIALSMEEPFIFYEDVPDAAGNLRNLQTTKRKYYNLDGKLCVLGSCQDVTDLVRIRRERVPTKEAYEQARSSSIIFTHIAQALARGYTDLYYVNLDSEEFIHYRSAGEEGTLTEARHGWHFFEVVRVEAEKAVHPDDREIFVKALDRKTLVAALKRNRSYDMSFRALTDSGSRYYSMKVTRMVDDERFIIIGLTDVDEQIRQRRAVERANEEQLAYQRLNALSSDYLSIYVVDPESGSYREISSTQRYDEMAVPKWGEDFFGTSRNGAKRLVYRDDQKRFLSAFTDENVMAEIARHRVFTLSYRLVMDGVPRYVQLKAALSEEKDGARLIVGVIDIDAEVRQEEEYVKHIAQARICANVDALTGVKNRHAYLEAEERLNEQLTEQRTAEYAIVIMDVNDLKKVNDIAGHQAGDQYLLDASRIICDVFKHSPIFRIGGDEFAVIAQGSDYAHMDELIAQMRRHNEAALRNGGIVIACGMARHEDEDLVALVFERADQSMYENKSALKAGRVRG